MMYYTVEARFWKSKIGNKLDNLMRGVDFSDAYTNINKEFRASCPIESRKEAFRYYQSLIDVLYDGLGKKYENDYQARIDLQYYLNSDNEIELGNSTKFKMTDDYLNGIEVYMVVEKPTTKGKIILENKHSIHGVRYIEYLDTLEEGIIENLENLFLEYRYYESHNYSYGDELVLKYFGAIGADAEFYLRTPFDWDIFMKEFEGKKLIAANKL